MRAVAITVCALIAIMAPALCSHAEEPVQPSPYEQALKLQISFAEITENQGDVFGCPSVLVAPKQLITSCKFKNGIARRLHLNGGSIYSRPASGGFVSTGGYSAPITVTSWAALSPDYAVVPLPSEIDAPPINIGTRPPALGEALLGIPRAGDKPSLCHVSDVLPEFHKFTYLCDPDAHAGSPHYIVRSSDKSLIGIDDAPGAFEGSPIEQAYGASLRYGGSTADDVTSWRQSPAFPTELKTAAKPSDVESILLDHLTCKAAHLIANDISRKEALSDDGLGRLVVVLHGCATQIGVNKGIKPEDQSLVLIRRVAASKPGDASYLMNTFSRNQASQSFYVCWMLGGHARVAAIKNYMNASKHADRGIDKSVCPEIAKKITDQDVAIINEPMQDADYEKMSLFLNDFGYADIAANIRKVWDAQQDLNPENMRTRTFGDSKVGLVQQKCLATYDDSWGVDRVEVVVQWNYQAMRTIMKKLSHCIRLNVTGPIEIKDVAADYVKYCVDYALNDNKNIYIFQGIVALGVDILSAGGTGGSATAAAVTNYIINVENKAINCLTSEKQIEARLASELKGKFDATVEQESHWVTWNM